MVQSENQQALIPLINLRVEFMEDWIKNGVNVGKFWGRYIQFLKQLATQGALPLFLSIQVIILSFSPLSSYTSEKPKIEIKTENGITEKGNNNALTT